MSISGVEEKQGGGGEGGEGASQNIYAQYWY